MFAMPLARIGRIILIILFWIVVISLYGFYISIRPPKYVTPIKPSDLNLEYEEVALTTADGLKLSAWFMPNNKTNNAVIVLHGYPFDKGNVLSLAGFLHNDYNMLFFDFRYMGKSQGKYTSVGFHEKKDVKAAIDYLKKEKKIKDIGILGFSLGASTAIMSAKENKEIKAIVADSAYASIDLMIESLYRMFLFLKWPFVALTKLYAYIFLGIPTKEINPVEDINSLDIPILLIHGEKDSQIDVKNSKLLKEAYPKAELWIVENADHGQAHAVKQKEYEKKVLDFFKESLG